MRDLHELPKLRDSISYLYIEHAIVDRKDYAIEYIDKEGHVLVPVAALCVLMLGPGTSITHAAIRVLVENGCSIVWIGEDAVHFYAQGYGETRKALHLIHQAELASDPDQRKEVVLRMYRKRFDIQLEPSLSLPQIRGMEGVRIRAAYAEASKKYGVAWNGRRYDLNDWSKADPINHALSAANSLLNGICHAAIVSGGYSPAMGFVHVGRYLSFVYDIADLYKTEITIPIAFQVMSENPPHLEAEVRKTCRAVMREKRLLDRILPDIDELLGMNGAYQEKSLDIDGSYDQPADLWQDLFNEEVQHDANHT
jgi:CRISPR-associated protein Cas1